MEVKACEVRLSHTLPVAKKGLPTLRWCRLKPRREPREIRLEVLELFFLEVLELFFLEVLELFFWEVWERRSRN